MIYSYMYVTGSPGVLSLSVFLSISLVFEHKYVYMFLLDGCWIMLIIHERVEHVLS